MAPRCPARRVQRLAPIAAAGAALLAALAAGTSCAATGREGRHCFPNDTCFAGLTCLSDRCVVVPDSLVVDRPGGRTRPAEADETGPGRPRDRGEGDGPPPDVISMSPESLSESETDIAVAPDGRIAVAWISATTRPAGDPSRRKTGPAKGKTRKMSEPEPDDARKEAEERKYRDERKKARDERKDADAGKDRDEPKDRKDRDEPKDRDRKDREEPKDRDDRKHDPADADADEGLFDPDDRASVKAFRASRSPRIAYAFSSDGGATWTKPAFVDEGAAADQWDPALTVDSRGAFYLAWGGGRRTSGVSERGIFVSAAEPGATHFGPAVRVTDPVTKKFDKPTITVTRRGTVLVTWVFMEGRGWGGAARSEDGGKTWSRSLIGAAPKRPRWLFAVCAPPDGDRVWVTYIHKNGIGLQWSLDDGRTWTATEGDVSGPDEKGDFAKTQSATCVANGRNVWVVYGHSHDRTTSAKLPRSHAIRVAYSRDGGRTFTERHDAHDPAAGDLFMLPKITRDLRGVLHLVYYAGSEGRGVAEAALRRSRSLDGGRTWLPSTPVRTGIDLVSSRTSKTWLGDYIGLTLRGDALFTSFVVNGEGVSHVAFKREVLAGEAGSAPGRAP